MINATYIPGFSSEQGIRHLVSPPTVTIRRLRSEQLHLVAFNWSTRSILVISVGLRCSSSYHSLTIHFYFIIWTVSILNWYSVWTSAYLYYYDTVSVLVMVRERVWIWKFPISMPLTESVVSCTFPSSTIVDFSLLRKATKLYLFFIQQKWAGLWLFGFQIVPTSASTIFIDLFWWKLISSTMVLLNVLLEIETD